MAAQTILPGFPFPAFVNQTGTQQTVLAGTMADLDIGGTYVAPTITPAVQAASSPYTQCIAPGFPFSVFVNLTNTQQTVLPNASFANLLVASGFHRMMMFFR